MLQTCSIHISEGHKRWKLFILVRVNLRLGNQESTKVSSNSQRPSEITMEKLTVYQKETANTNLSIPSTQQLTYIRTAQNSIPIILNQLCVCKCTRVYRPKLHRPNWTIPSTLHMWLTINPCML